MRTRNAGPGTTPDVGPSNGAHRSRAARAGSPPITATLHWILRLAVAACFIGHGAFGIITKAAWLPYFAVFGIPESWAWRLMPVVGAVDIAVGTLTLFQPVRAVVLYMAFWGFQTACLRPLAGQGVWELLERAGNYGVPLAFLGCLAGPVPGGLVLDAAGAAPHRGAGAGDRLDPAGDDRRCC